MIPEQQPGFQPRRSTLDTLASISQRAMENLQKPKPERTLLNAVDFTAAFDRVWKGGLLRDLASWNLPKRCLARLRASLSDRRGIYSTRLKFCSWGLTAIDLTTLYKTYVRSGGTYASVVWFKFLADSWAEKLESANYQAARVITGIPRGPPIHPTCMEAGLPPIRVLAEHEGALLLHKIKSLQEDHHLRKIAAQHSRPRLRSRGHTQFRPDWRSQGDSPKAPSRLPERDSGFHTSHSATSSPPGSVTQVHTTNQPTS